MKNLPNPFQLLINFIHTDPQHHTAMSKTFAENPTNWFGYGISEAELLDSAKE